MDENVSLVDDNLSELSMNKISGGIMANADLAVLNETRRSRSGYRKGRVFINRPPQTVL